MVDLPLMAALLSALPRRGTHSGAPFSLVFVGDADQLPSVGPGQVLRDLCAAPGIPRVRLTRIYRQAAQSGIVGAANTILGGRVPDSGEHTGHDDYFAIVRDNPDLARETLLKVVADRLPAKGFDALKDVQVLTPTRRGPARDPDAEPSAAGAPEPGRGSDQEGRAGVPGRGPRLVYAQPVRRGGVQR